MVKVWAEPWQDDLSVMHTGSPSVVIGEAIEQIEVVTQTLEFVAGKASIQYRATVLDAQKWLYADLGDIALVDKNLTAEDMGYSVAEVSYQRRYFAFPVTLPVEKSTTQFLVLGES